MTSTLASSLSSSIQQVFIVAPPGRLGILLRTVGSPKAQAEDYGGGAADNNALRSILYKDYVTVCNVDPNGPLVGRVQPGDCLARVDSVDTGGMDVPTVVKVVSDAAGNPSRSLTFYRPIDTTIASSSSSYWTTNNAEGRTILVKENDTAVNQTPQTATATTLASTAAPPKKPHPPSNAAFIDLTTTCPSPTVAGEGASNHSSATVKRPFTSVSSKTHVYGPPAKKKRSKSKKQRAVSSACLPSQQLTTIEPENIPPPGFDCVNHTFYSTLNNETLHKVAEKLGSDWKNMAALHENARRYGPLKASTNFKVGTLLCIPPNKRSEWKMKQLSPNKHKPNQKQLVQMMVTTTEDEQDSEHPQVVRMGGGGDDPMEDTCVDCGMLECRSNDSPATAAGILLCDGCDALHHVACVGLTAVPSGDWFCASCLEILHARRHAAAGNAENRHAAPQQDSNHAIGKQRDAATTTSSAGRGCVFQLEALPPLEMAADNHAADKTIKERETLLRNCLTSRKARDVANLQSRHKAIWERAAKLVSTTNWDGRLLAGMRESLQKVMDGLPLVEKMDRHKLEVEYASLLNDPMMTNETKGAFKQREFPPRCLGRAHLSSEADVLALNMLMKPDELVLATPVVHPNSYDEQFEPLQVGRTYDVHARKLLFDKSRDDELPMEKNGVRDAQRHLFTLLSSNDTNKAMIVARPSIPPTVKLRSDDDSGTRCFNLSELVRDCNVDLDLPKEPTPASMAANGLDLRSYQQASLRWMLDKEKETTGLGLAGELWHRLRFLDASAPADYFYCELTGSFALEIFDFRSDVNQQDASMNRFCMPTGGVLGEEMGLGKTVIAIALILQNPPPLCRRVLPREHLWSLEKKTTVYHPAYVPHPSVGQNCRLSNGTLVVVPMTLLSQWQSELERFAPHLRVLTLHNAENPTFQEIASCDVVIASTFLLQQQQSRGSKKKAASSLLRFLKRIHWHRLIVDEAHYNQHCKKTKLALASLSVTHRAAVTGTPIGAQLSDLQGQLRFLRLAPFSREAFWKNNIEDPYYERSPEALRVLRSLLSRIVVRHSKEQTFANGQALLSLPPRTVETVLLPFGSNAEREVYNAIEARNQNHFVILKRESLSTIASNYLALNGMLTSARQACSHPSLINVEKLNRFNEMTAAKYTNNKKVAAATPSHKTREGIFASALSKARNSAKLRMRVELNRFQSSQLLECPVCFECVGEEDIALPACAHPFCTRCVSSILDAASSKRDASGHCPTCRDIMRKLEITYLGDASDAGTLSKNEAAEARHNADEQDSKPPAVSMENGFQVTATNVHVSVAGASTLRAGRAAMTAAQRRHALHEDRAVLSTLQQGFLENYYESKLTVGTKIAELLVEINAMIKRDDRSKCVVFSQFLGMLDIASEELQARGIGVVRLDGNCKQHERADALLEFSCNAQVRVFLLSMRSGAVGLNLTAADHCFILDCAQNSAIEEQGIDRIHRIGQTRPVIVKRFIIEDTVEERLLRVRRSLGVDNPTTTGTQICGASVIEDEEEEKAERAARRGRGRQSTDDDSTKDGLLDDAKRQLRVETLEALEDLFGCAGKTVHKA